MNGTNGANGTDGANGTNGIDGTNGTNGTNGAPGPAGPSGADGSSESSVDASSLPPEERLLRIDAKTLTPGTTALKARVARVRVYCRPIADTSCAGTLKIRSVAKVRSGLTKSAKLARVTFGTAPIQLPRRKVGFVKVMLDPAKYDLLAKRLGHVKVTLAATIIDGAGNRQVITKTVTLTK